MRRRHRLECCARTGLCAAAAAMTHASATSSCASLCLPACRSAHLISRAQLLLPRGNECASGSNLSLFLLASAAEISICRPADYYYQRAKAADDDETSSCTTRCARGTLKRFRLHYAFTFTFTCKCVRDAIIAIMNDAPVYTNTRASYHCCVILPT